jgi:hypothetical protein
MVFLEEDACMNMRFYRTGKIRKYVCMATDPIKLKGKCSDKKCPLYDPFILDEDPT